MAAVIAIQRLWIGCLFSMVDVRQIVFGRKIMKDVFLFCVSSFLFFDSERAIISDGCDCFASFLDDDS
jgi:hypothetical protein